MSYKVVQTCTHALGCALPVALFVWIACKLGCSK